MKLTPDQKYLHKYEILQNKFKGKAKHCLVPRITRNTSLQSVRKSTQKSGSLPSR